MRERRVPIAVPPELEPDPDYTLCRTWDEERKKGLSTANSDINVIWLIHQAAKLEKKIA